MSCEIAVLRTLLRFARSPRRLGPASLANVVSRVGEDPAVVHRALASLARQGLVLKTPEGVRLSLSGLAIAVACGLWLVVARGSRLLPLGVAGVALVLAYTSWLTRNPWACLVAPGLGFGPLMVVGTHIAVAGRYNTSAGVASLVPFFLVDALLLLNQFPDVEADRETGRRHLPIAWGRPRAARVLVALYALAYVSLVAGVIVGIMPRACLLGLLTAPLAFVAARDAVRHADDPSLLLPAMARNVVVNLATPALVALGFLLG